MDIFTAVVVFILTWWVVIFAVLPWGNKPEENPEIGHARSAPANPRLKQKFIWTTVISALITAAIILTINYSGYSFREQVKTWSLEE